MIFLSIIFLTLLGWVVATTVHNTIKFSKTKMGDDDDYSSGAMLWTILTLLIAFSLWFIIGLGAYGLIMSFT
jgi:hypothetical protein